MGLIIVVWRRTQGSRVDAATLGWMMESRWDSDDRAIDFRFV
jgi:hypothetical protein